MPMGLFMHPNDLPPQPDAQPSSGEPEESDAIFPVVGIGASAGGMRALRQFLEATPADSGMAFVIVIHLSPDHESHMAELLSTHAPIPVQQVVETMPLHPNHAYVIPPNRNLSAIDTQLRLDPLENERRARAPIDHFLRTLAGTHKNRAICVLLSGGGADGAKGLETIKEFGGLTVVQEPTEAEYDSMPLSAIATRQVDLILPVSQMPGQILQYVRRQDQLLIMTESDKLAPHVQETVQKLLTQVRIQTGHDFSRYKLATILRRILHRMQICNLTDIEEYFDLVRTTPNEADALFNDFLITVTNFFREPEAFETLAQKVVPAIFEGKRQNDQVRVWSIGCATGEEAYSLERVNDLGTILDRVTGCVRFSA
jgi:two-component system CheB/CheR fusion protein